MYSNNSHARNGTDARAFGLVVSTDGSVSLCKNSDGVGHVCATKFVQTASGMVCPFLRISSTLPPSGLVEEFNLRKIAEVMCLKNKGRRRFQSSGKILLNFSTHVVSIFMSNSCSIKQKVKECQSQNYCHFMRFSVDSIFLHD